MYKCFGTVKTRNCIYIHSVTENVLITSKKYLEEKNFWIFTPIQHRLTSHAKYTITKETLISLHCIVLRVTYHCAHYASQ
jgi:hypothetical protein